MKAMRQRRRGALWGEGAKNQPRRTFSSSPSPSPCSTRSKTLPVQQRCVHPLVLEALAAYAVDLKGLPADVLQRHGLQVRCLLPLVYHGPNAAVKELDRAEGRAQLTAE